MLPSITEIVHEFLRDSPAANKRRCANRAGVRDSEELVADCRHGDHWDHVRGWCSRCGITAKEFVERLRR